MESKIGPWGTFLEVYTNWTRNTYSCQRKVWHLVLLPKSVRLCPSNGKSFLSEYSFLIKLQCQLLHISGNQWIRSQGQAPWLVGYVKEHSGSNFPIWRMEKVILSTHLHQRSIAMNQRINIWFCLFVCLMKSITVFTTAKACSILVHKLKKSLYKEFKYPKESKVGSWRAICTSMFITAVFTIAKRRKQTSVHQQMNG